MEINYWNISDKPTTFSRLILKCQVGTIDFTFDAQK